MSNNYVGQTCPYCQFPIKPDDEIVYCSACNLPHHAQCWQENGKCTTFGCDGHPVTTPTDKYPGVNRDASYIDLTIDDCICSRCGASNSISAAFCSQCGNNLSEHQLTPNTVFCSRCGCKNTVTDNICFSCNAPLKQATQGLAQQTLTYSTPYLEQPTLTVPASGQSPASIYGQPGYPPTVPINIDNHMVFSILSTLCCCLPCGIVAIVYASKVNDKIQVGDYAGAIEAANNAKNWCWISFGCGLILIFIGIASH